MNNDLNEEDIETLAEEALQRKLEQLKQEVKEQEKRIALREQKHKENKIVNLVSAKNKRADELIESSSSLIEYEQIKKIEEALTNSFFISEQFQTPEYQLIMIDETKKQGKITEGVYQSLIELRISELPEEWKWVEKKDASGEAAFMRANDSELCQTVKNELTLDANYQKSLDKFIKRINGINEEIQRAEEGEKELQSRLDALKSVSVGILKGDSKAPADLKPIAQQEELNENQLVNKKEPLSVREISKKEENIKENYEVYDFPFNDSALLVEDPHKYLNGYENLLTQFIPENERGKFLLDKVAPISLREIMRASLTAQKARSPEEKTKQNMQYVMKACEVAAKAKNKLDEKMANGNIFSNSSYQNSVSSDGIVDDLKRALGEVEKEYGEARKEKEVTKLENLALSKTFFDSSNARSYRDLKAGLKKCNFEVEYDSKYAKLLDRLRESKDDNRKGIVKELEKHIDRSTDGNKNISGAQAVFKSYKKQVAFFNRLHQLVDQHPGEQLNVYQSGIICKSKSP